MPIKRTPAHMRRLVTQWRVSGESAAGFARRHRVHPWTFWYWCRKQSTEAPASPDTPRTAFVPVQVVAETAAAAVEVVLPSGERLHVRAGASLEVVQAVVTALRSRC
jgi:transposase-like protein